MHQLDEIRLTVKRWQLSLNMEKKQLRILKF